MLIAKNLKIDKKVKGGAGLKKEVIIQTEDVKVRVIELRPGEVAPFHRHTEVTDNIFGISGEMTVIMKNPDENKVLTPGTHCKIEIDRVHQVINNRQTEGSKYLLIQGIGKYDFIRENA
ncbi:MAG: cupin domain-containing protein [Desulfobulbaceae bacterium]|nr:cupin domain-containing protein [Desulfobulbaceae bacterium]